VADLDRSYGEITEWAWYFGDGESSSEQHPTHRYAKPGDYVVTLTVTGPKGTSKWTKVWDVALP
ncbi:MAG: PKD domain-containing protein, partial [Planctomycetaceae bacterium]|nr:PKD domain-containing protein [Planctomycetaceae bacterium]